MATTQETLNRIWNDAALKDRLMTQPTATLKELGLALPDGVTAYIHENSTDVYNAVLPMKTGAKSTLGPDPMSRVIERAWNDTAFKKQLLSDPKEAANSVGVTVPGDVEVRVWEDTPTSRHFVLPKNPADSELSELELESVAGGKGTVKSREGTLFGGGNFF